MSVTIPADVDRPDRILWGLTLRQLLLLAAGLGPTWAALVMLQRHLPHLPVAAGAIVVSGALVAASLARPHGLAPERWLLLALRHLASPSRRVLAPEGLPPLPRWARGARRIGPLHVPVDAIDGDSSIELEGGARALVCRASAVDLTLASSRERDQLIAAFARVLNSLEGATSFVVRSQRCDVTRQLETLERSLDHLPHPALRSAARAHAAFLKDLSSRPDSGRREVYVAITSSTAMGRDALRRRADAAEELLGAVGIELRRLGPSDTAEVVADAWGRAGTGMHDAVIRGHRG